MPESGKDPDGEGGHARLMPFIEMKAPALGQDVLARQFADNQFAAVSNHGGLGKSRDVSVGNPDGFADSVA